jgi:hypothetical protein
MTESVFNKVQLGQQTAIATAVATTTVFPVDEGFTGFELDRAAESPNEDFGSSSREFGGRGSTGVRWATASLPFVGRFQDIMHIQQMHFDTATTAGSAPYTHTTIFDDSGSAPSTALKPYTMHYGVIGSTQDEWVATGVLIDTLDFGFDALSAPGNSMWNGSAGLVALDRGNGTMTASQTAPATLETMEGHKTTLNEGAIGTAFASLSALTGSLRQFRFNSSLNLTGRPYGGATDLATYVGQTAKGEVGFDALVAFGATAKTDTVDIYNVAGDVMTDRRWRITIDGSGNNLATLDFRCRFTATDVGIDNGERLYAVNGVFVYDSTLASRAMWITTNDIATIP